MLYTGSLPKGCFDRASHLCFSAHCFPAAFYVFQHMPLAGKEGLTRRLEANGVRFAQVSDLGRRTRQTRGKMARLPMQVGGPACFSHNGLCADNQAEADAKAIFDAFHVEAEAAKKKISAKKRAAGELKGPPIEPQLLQEMLAYCA